VLCFVLLGAAIGLSLAERIADPVRRLTRATRRIAAGDFDARIAVRSADELRRLVDSFNSMASELKAQRTQLERTHRLEAWAEMARQVAHEIKNPLTPIQLSAEHLLRVHANAAAAGAGARELRRAILGQWLLRQISAEFSSFASSPTARRAGRSPVPVAEVINPYRTGLEADRDRQPGPAAAAADRRRSHLIARALANIIENAPHAMPAQGRSRSTRSPKRPTCLVARQRLGMDPRRCRKFEPHFTKTTGTGLGLRSPAERRTSGGSIEVGEKGVGTVVRCGCRPRKGCDRPAQIVRRNNLQTVRDAIPYTIPLPPHHSACSSPDLGGRRRRPFSGMTRVLRTPECSPTAAVQAADRSLRAH
jgi:nitrogen fixation/metabolism regulation signal transduction histidine kinase